MATNGNTIIIGLSGPSSSGKTTLARLVRQIFNTYSPSSTSSLQVRLFILHEDDFYKTDKLVPRKTFASAEFGTRDLDDWDCVESLDLPLLRRVLQYVKQHGTLPDDFASKEDENTVGVSGVSDEQVEGLRQDVQKWLEGIKSERSATITICLLDGFLLYPNPASAVGTLERELHDILVPLLDLKLFLPSTRTKTIDRRTKRTGYVTLEGFWEDPPGYVEDVVWPNYRQDHGWLFGNREIAADEGQVDRDVAKRAGILIGPGNGDVHLKEILPWAVERITQAMSSIER